MLLGQRYIYLTRYVTFVPKPGTKHFVPVSCKHLQKFHIGLSSYRSELVPVSCKYPLGCWTETRNSRTGLSSYRSHVNDNKSQTGVTAFCVPPCYLFPRVICSPEHWALVLCVFSLPHPIRQFSAMCSPFMILVSCTTCLLLDFFVLIVVQMNESLYDNIVKSINTYYEGRQKSIR